MAGLEDDIEQKKQDAASNEILSAVTDDNTKTGEETAGSIQATVDAQDDLDAEKRESEVLKKINEKNAFFDPTNYITPAAPSADKLTNEDYYPGLNQNVIQGYHQGKFFNSALVGSSNVAPMAVISARRKELAQQAYTKAKNEEIAKGKVLAFKVTAAPQFIAELQDQAMLYTKEMVGKYGNNYQALLKDPDYINTMQKFDTEGKKTLYVHERILKTQKDAQKSNLIINPENVKLFGEYANGSGDFDAKTVADKIRKGEFSATTFADKIKTNDNLEAWSKTSNLDRFVTTIKKEDISKMPKGGTDKYVKIGSTDTHVDKEAYLKGLAEYAREYDLYNSGNPDAPTDSPEYKKWEKFSQNQLESDMKYKNVDEKTKEIKIEQNIEAQRLAWDKDKYAKESVQWYNQVHNDVTEKHKGNVTEIFNNLSLTPQQKDAQIAQYYRKNGLQPEKVFGMNSFRLPSEPKEIGAATNRVLYSVHSKQTGKSTPMNSAQIVKQYEANLKGGKYVGGYMIPKGLYDEAKLLIVSKTTKMARESEYSTTMLRHQDGLQNPYTVKDKNGNPSKLDPNSLTNVVVSVGRLQVGEDATGKPVYSQYAAHLIDENNTSFQNSALGDKTRTSELNKIP